MITLTPEIDRDAFVAGMNELHYGNPSRIKFYSTAELHGYAPEINQLYRIAPKRIRWVTVQDDLYSEVCDDLLVLRQKGFQDRMLIVMIHKVDRFNGLLWYAKVLGQEDV